MDILSNFLEELANMKKREWSQKGLRDIDGIPLIVHFNEMSYYVQSAENDELKLKN